MKVWIVYDVNGTPTTYDSREKAEKVCREIVERVYKDYPEDLTDALKELEECNGLSVSDVCWTEELEVY